MTLAWPRWAAEETLLMPIVAMLRTMQCTLVSSFFLCKSFECLSTHTIEGCLCGSHILNQTYILDVVNIKSKSVHILFCWPPTLVWTWHSAFIIYTYPQFARMLDISRHCEVSFARSTLVRTLLIMKSAKHSPNILWLRPLCLLLAPILVLQFGLHRIINSISHWRKYCVSR